MDQKLKELTEKLYNEGVSKGNEEAEKITAEAKTEAEKIIADAQSKAKEIIEKAEQESAELDKNTKSELELASRQMLTALEQEITTLINGQITQQEIKKATDDKEFLQNLILSTVSNWAPKQDLLVIVSPKDEKEVEKFFASKAKQILDKGLKIESANNVKAGFEIGPADGSYKVSFTQEDFIEFFKAFLRPKVVELLFNRK
jgi:V/A-type H+-transporting ATPase subunit E